MLWTLASIAINREFCYTALCEILYR